MSTSEDTSALPAELRALAQQVSVSDDEKVQKEAAAVLKLLPDLATHPEAPYFQVSFRLALEALGADPPKTVLAKRLRKDLEEKTRSYKAPLRAMTRNAPSTWTIVGLGALIYFLTPPIFLFALTGGVSALDDELVLVPALGALGGTVSILARIPRLMEEARPNPVSSFFNGFSKPLIGAAFALFLYLIIQSRLLAFDLDRYSAKELFLALGFLAGFSERLIPDLVRRTETMVSSTAYRGDTHGDERTNTQLGRGPLTREGESVEHAVSGTPDRKSA